MNQVQLKLTHIDRENQKAQFLIKWVQNLYTFIHIGLFCGLLLNMWANKYVDGKS